MQDKPAVLVLCRDLMFGSKITSAAKAAGVSVKMVRDPAKLAEETASPRLIADLNQAGFLDAAQAWKTQTGGYVTGFVGHVNTETISRARTMGIDSVLSNGTFVARLAEVLRGGGVQADPGSE
jgi:hypothetical protein